MPRRYPWQIPNQRQLDPDEIIPRQGSIHDFIDFKIFKQVMMKRPKPLDQKKMVFAARQALDEAGPSHQARPVLLSPRPLPVPFPVPLPAMPAPLLPAVQNLVQLEVEDEVVNLPNRRTSPAEFQVSDLRRFINLEEQAADWTTVDTDPDVRNIITTLKSKFFRNVPKILRYAVDWRDLPDQQTNFVFDVANQQITNQIPKIFFNSKLKKCSRITLINTVLHAMIHIAVYETSASTKRNINDHDVNFRLIMESFNRRLGLEIGTAHEAIRAQGEEREMYRCGLCALRYNRPFKGIVVSAENMADVGPIHRQNCHGNFHKVLKVSRTDNNNEEIRHIVHNRIAMPRIGGNDGPNAGHNLQPRELVNLADNDGDATVVDLVPQIDLQDPEFDVNRGRPRAIARQLTGQQDFVFQFCAFCNRNIGVGAFGQHLDACLGA